MSFLTWLFFEPWFHNRQHQTVPHFDLNRPQPTATCTRGLREWNAPSTIPDTASLAGIGNGRVKIKMIPLFPIFRYLIYKLSKSIRYKLHSDQTFLCNRPKRVAGGCHLTTLATSRKNDKLWKVGGKNQKSLSYISCTSYIYI